MFKQENAMRVEQINKHNVKLRPGDAILKRPDKDVISPIWRKQTRKEVPPHSNNPQVCGFDHDTQLPD